jgi:hypothetical protein
MVEFENCLIVTRHKLLEAQDKDIDEICKNTALTPELPNDPAELSILIKRYDAVIGVIPLYLQVQVLQNGKALVMFVMRSIGVTDKKEDAEYLATKYPGRSAVLPPSKEGEKHRVVIYEGMKLVKDVKIIDEWIIQHES